MSLLDGLFKRNPPTIEKGVASGFFNFFAPNSMPKMGEKEAMQAFNGWVYACTNVIAERIADMELFLEKKASDHWQKIDSHESIDLLHNANPFTSFMDLAYSYEAYQQLNGNILCTTTKVDGIDLPGLESFSIAEQAQLCLES